MSAPFLHAERRRGGMPLARDALSRCRRARRRAPEGAARGQTAGASGVPQGDHPPADEMCHIVQYGHVINYAFKCATHSSDTSALTLRAGTPT